jgi:hypothetical protein
MADGPTIAMTIRPDGARANGTPPVPDILACVVGCSFTLGWQSATTRLSARVFRSADLISTSSIAA